MASIIDAIVNLSGGTAQVAIKDNDIDNIEWLDGTAPIAKADILAKQTELTEAEDAAKAQKATDKVNALSKLEALGLSSAEIDALTK